MEFGHWRQGARPEEKVERRCEFPFQNNSYVVLSSFTHPRVNSGRRNTKGSPQKALPLHKTSTRKQLFAYRRIWFFPKPLMRQPLEQQIIPLLKRINESLLSPREVVTLSYEDRIQSKLVVYQVWRDRFLKNKRGGERAWEWTEGPS